MLLLLQDTAQTLISIILLDSIPLPSALSLLLAQRTRLLRDAVANSTAGFDGPASSSSSQGRKGLTNGMSRSGSSTAVPTRRPSVQLDEGDVKRVLAEIVGVLGGTVGLARDVFGSKRVSKSKGAKSLIVGMMEGIEKGEEEPTRIEEEHANGLLSPRDGLGALPPSTPTSKDKTHQRRASRLASISMPFSLPSPSSPSGSGSFPAAAIAEPVEPPVISTPSLLLTLPSSPLLLRYLPASVKAYTPFLSSSSAPSSLPAATLASSLSTWLTTNTSFLRSSVEDLSSSLTSVRAVWEVRDEVRRALVSVEGLDDSEREAMEVVLEAGWEKRVQEIWDGKLAGLATKLDSTLKDRIEVIKLGAKESDGGQQTDSRFMVLL